MSSSLLYIAIVCLNGTLNSTVAKDSGNAKETVDSVGEGTKENIARHWGIDVPGCVQKLQLCVRRDILQSSFVEFPDKLAWQITNIVSNK